MATASDGAPAASICIGCGLCCDGTVVTHLAVSDESDLGWPLRALGVELIVAADPPVFALPCPAVVDGACSVYHRHRPHACEQFACALLHDVTDGRVTPDAARATIADTLARRARVRAGTEDAASFDAHVERVFRR